MVSFVTWALPIYFALVFFVRKVYLLLDVVLLAAITFYVIFSS